jgi:hypothetical protein
MTTTIEKKDVGEYEVTGTWSKVCSISPDKDSKKKKTITLELKFQAVPLSGIIEKAIRPAVISWQNSQGRKHWGKWTDKQVVKIDFTAPAATPQRDPMEVLIEEAKANGIDPSDEKAMTKFIMTKLGQAKK